MNTRPLTKVVGTPTFVGSLSTEITNRNFGSAKIPSATIQHDTNITGLTNNGTIFFDQLDTVSKIFHLRTTSNIIILQGTAIAFYEETAAATGVITCLVSIVEEESR